VLFSTLNRRHECCDLSTFRKYNALYEGGLAFKKCLGEFLFRNPQEDNGTYDLRKREAYYRGYVGPIVDFFSAQLFSAPFIVRTTTAGKATTPDDFYSTFKEDADMCGTDLVSFMKTAFTGALVNGSAWLVAEMPDDADVPAESLQDYQDRGLGRARLTAIDSSDVFDWSVDSYGEFAWIITHSKEVRRDDPRQEKLLTTETWKLYDAETVETFQVVYDANQKPKDKDNIPSISKVPHKFPRVPFVQLRLPPGLWLLNRAADAQVEHFRLANALSWSIKRTAYPMAIFKSQSSGDEKGSAPLPRSGAGNLQIIGSDESFSWMSPPTESFDVLQKEIDVQKNEIYRISQQMAASINNNAAGLGRSGESKLADQAATEICLAAYASAVKETLEEVYELISDGRGDLDLKFSIEGMSHFSLNDVTTSLANIKAARDLSIESPTLKKELSMKAADLLLPDASQETKDLIREEIQTASEEKPKEVPPPPVTDPLVNSDSQENVSSDTPAEQPSAPHDEA